MASLFGKSQSGQSQSGKSQSTSYASLTYQMGGLGLADQSYGNSTRATINIGNDVEDYLTNNVKNARTELNLFIQQMKIELPRFNVEPVGKDFEATCVIRLITEEGWRRKEYRDSAIASNSKNAQL